jgi:hypothetical protein
VPDIWAVPEETIWDEQRDPFDGDEVSGSTRSPTARVG